LIDVTKNINTEKYTFIGFVFAKEDELSFGLHRVNNGFVAEQKEKDRSLGHTDSVSAVTSGIFFSEIPVAVLAEIPVSFLETSARSELTISRCGTTAILPRASFQGKSSASTEDEIHRTDIRGET
jgi:hypothetical protein